MIYKIKEHKNKLIERTYIEAMKEFNSFFGFNWITGTPNICVLKNRKEIDLISDYKTERYIIGFAKGGTAYILDNRKMEEESEHKKYTEEEYSKKLIKHEICHLFYQVVSKDNNDPKWLAEGVSIFLSGEMKFKKPITRFINFIEFHQKSGGEVYTESGTAIKLLVENFGKKKLLKLISQSGKAKNKKDFAKLFKEIYNFDLNYKNFNNLLNSKNKLIK